MPRSKPTAHVIAPDDRARITCDHCAAPAVMCEHSPHYGGVSFWHYCGDCWLLPAANGGPSAAERTGVDLSREDDLERLWLAECRAHGETRRKLEAERRERAAADRVLDSLVARILPSDEHAPKGGWAAQPEKMRRVVSHDDAYMARDHLESFISKPEGE